LLLEAAGKETAMAEQGPSKDMYYYQLDRPLLRKTSSITKETERKERR
jgi:hypothetical protein